MVEFEKVKSEEITFGENNFLEVARKRAISEEGANEFIAFARGYFTEDGDRRYKTNFSVPLDADVVEFILDRLPEMLTTDE